MGIQTEFYSTSGDEPEDHWFTGTLATIRAAGTGTDGKLSMVEFVHPAGYATPPHVHHNADEAFYVIEGAVDGFCGNRTWQATVGGFVWLPQGIPHGYLVEGDQTLRTLAITVPAGFDEFVVELSEPARAHTLPADVFLPDMETFLAVGTKHGIEQLGPPGAPAPGSSRTEGSKPRRGSR